MQVGFELTFEIIFFYTFDGSLNQTIQKTTYMWKMIMYYMPCN